MDDVKENGEYEAVPPEGAPLPVHAADTPDQPVPETVVPVEPAPADLPPNPPVPPKQPDSWFETVKTVVYALLIALVIRTFLFQPFNIPSASMEGTLLIGDYLFVEKFSYGYSRHSFPFSFMPFSGRVFGSAPKRGDVVVFKMPNQDSPDYMKDYIKRVIGLPGDRIQVIHSRLFINNKIVPRVKVADYVETVDGVEHHIDRYRETLPNGKSYFTLDMEPDGQLDNTGVYVVTAGHYFMMGDNRDNSDDSRDHVGYVPAEDLVGKAEFIFFSIDVDNDWWKFWQWPVQTRYSRMFTGID
ncbi:MAG TPA: signal peptidase I [Rhizomicrobium sp.]|jgi:signal peptidase I